MEFDLAGRRILIVGASAGIGEATAEMAAEAGAHVAVCARRADKLEEIAARIGNGAVAVPGDVSKQADCERIVPEAIEKLGALDAVIYMTGISPLKTMAEATLEDWRQTYDTNVFGAALIGAAAAPHLIERHGKLLLVSSKSTRQIFPGLAMYSTSKIALEGLFRSFKAEYPDLEITKVTVGNTAGTEFASAWDAETMEKMTEWWISSGAMGSIGMMHPRYIGQAILAVVAARGYIDEIAIIDRNRDTAEW